MYLSKKLPNTFLQYSNASSRANVPWKSCFDHDYNPIVYWLWFVSWSTNRKPPFTTGRIQSSLSRSWNNGIVRFCIQLFYYSEWKCEDKIKGSIFRLCSLFGKIFNFECRDSDGDVILYPWNSWHGLLALLWKCSSRWFQKGNLFLNVCSHFFFWLKLFLSEMISACFMYAEQSKNLTFLIIRLTEVHIKISKFTQSKNFDRKTLS